MLGDLFYWLCNMSIIATVAGTVILLIRSVKRIPRRLVALLWAIPFLRMWIPVGLGSRYGLAALFARFTTRTVVFYEPTDGLTFSAANCIMVADSYFPITYQVNLLEQVFRVASVIWIIIAVGLLLAFGLLYTITLRELRDAELLRENIYLSDKLTTPAVYGILRPKIILPTSYREQDLTFILLHEQMHIKRRDNLWRVIGYVTAAVHWFNPLAWIFLRCFLSDLELACDEKVLAVCGAEQKKAYAHALLDCAESKNVFASAFGGAKIRVRITHILSYRKLSALSVSGLIALAAAIAYTLLTNAA